MKATVTYNEKKYEVNVGIKIGELLKKVEPNYEDIYAVILNNRLHSIEHVIKFDCLCIPVRYEDSVGRKMYENTLKYIFLMALSQINATCKVKCVNKLGYNPFILPVNFKFESRLIEKIKEKMKKIISSAYEIKRLKISMEEAEKCYEKMGYDYHVDKYNPCCDDYTIYVCENYANYLYARLLPYTSYIKSFDLKLFGDGVIIVMPKKENNNILPSYIESTKAFSNDYISIMEIEKLEDLNTHIIAGKSQQIIQLSELMQNTKLLLGVQDILNSGARFVFIAGPSSSGKTTFSKKLSRQLEVLGRKSIVVSMDDYFKDFCDSPTDQNGNKNFDSINHLDIELFKKHMLKLIEGQEIAMPTYNFSKNGGEKEYLAPPVRINKDTIIIIEGIHAINPVVSEFLKTNEVFKIFVSPLVTLSYDSYTKVSSTYTRFLRRLVRDYLTRGMSPEYTFKAWENVINGENENIFPYVNDVNLVFNTSLVYETCVLKNKAETVLRKCDKKSQYYYWAKDLYEMLQRFESISSEFVPVDSLLREFIGGSCF